MCTHCIMCCRPTHFANGAKSLTSTRTRRKVITSRCPCWRSTSGKARTFTGSISGVRVRSRRVRYEWVSGAWSPASSRTYEHRTDKPCYVRYACMSDERIRELKNKTIQCMVLRPITRFGIGNTFVILHEHYSKFLKKQPKFFFCIIQ